MIPKTSTCVTNNAGCHGQRNGTKRNEVVRVLCGRLQKARLTSLRSAIRGTRFLNEPRPSGSDYTLVLASPQGTSRRRRNSTGFQVSHDKEVVYSKAHASPYARSPRARRMHPYFEDYWPWYVTAWGLYALGGLLLSWALFWDRSKRGGVVRYRCPKCWYDLSSVSDYLHSPDQSDEVNCAECGCHIRSSRDLFHTRRNRAVRPSLCSSS